jgi:Predicted membrane protein (DUF2085)
MAMMHSASNTGMFGAVLLGSLALAALHNTHASRFPKLKFWPVLLLFAATWVVDGFNSYVLLLTRAPLWYMPQNPIRLLTGALMGLCIACVVVPFINQIVWRPELRSEQHVLRGWRDLGVLLIVALAWVLLVLWQPSALYGPFTLLSSLGTFFMLSVVNGLTVLLITQRDQRMQQWHQLRWPILIGCALAALEIAGISALRGALTQRLGLPY